MEESEWIEKIKSNDLTALGTFYEVYKDMVYNVCYRLLSNRQDAEDATQDVFIKVFRAIRKFRGDAKLTTWLYQIAVNTSLNYERRKKLTNWLSLDFLIGEEKSISFSNTQNRPDLELEKSESEDIVWQAILSLPQRQRTAVILQRYEELSYKDIAEVMKTSLSAVESLLHHAKDNLTPKLLTLLK